MTKEELRRDKQLILQEIAKSGGVPGKGNAMHCPFHNDKTASAAIRKSKTGTYYFKCYKCNIWFDVIDLMARNQGISVKEVLSNNKIKDTKPEYKACYKSLEELLQSIDCIAIEEVNLYTNPETGNHDLVTIRILQRDDDRKRFVQAYQSGDVYWKKRPDGMLPLFNRGRILHSDTVLFVEGEKVVRFATKLGYTATTGSGGSNNADLQDLFILCARTVYLWADNDKNGKDYMQRIIERCHELPDPPKIRLVDIDSLELPQGGDLVDLWEKFSQEGGTEEEFKEFVDSILEDTEEINELDSLETYMEDMRTGRYTNFKMKDFPIITNEAMMLLNKRIGVIYGSAGMGKSFFISALCDDLVEEKKSVVRLQLEDELEQHLIRSMAQRLNRAEIVNPDWHQENPEESRKLFQDYKPLMEKISRTVISGESQDWTVDSILDWIERQLKLEKELIVVDPVSVIMTDKIWITSHKLIWKTKKLLSEYPQSRVLFVSHSNTEGEVAGGQAYKRFCHTLLTINKFKEPKHLKIADRYGEVKVIEAPSSIKIAKSRYGRGQGLEIATDFDKSSLKLIELGVILEEIKEKKKSGRDMMEENGD